ncbi:SHOCT domain-containing protein [Pseudoruegeria sp. HB172150]|uniref:SHOCT domain-containing protein n=1 Tax=Pseudoruegeria sp. HB172150 TaxID=2721164 RepID=UPI001C131518|nr:SHOCT domain-containing protein [Pseudoruegeria sp. HB172150]
MTRKRGPANAAQPEPAVAPAPASAGGLDADAIARLKELADLKAAGILTDAEFEAQKARILNA